MMLRSCLVFAAVLAPFAALAATPAGGEVDRSMAMLSGPTGIIAWLAAFPIVLPLLGSAVTLTLRSYPRAQLGVALAAMVGATLSAVALTYVVLTDGTVMMSAGNWLPPFGIVIAVDAVGALFVLATCLVGLVGLGYAHGDIDGEGTEFGFYTFYCLLIGGVCGAFATGDIFNLYVWFEVFLVSSFGLMVLGGREIQLDGAVKYGVLNLIATTIFLIAVAALYGVTGTLNMADIRGVLAGTEGGPLVTIGALFVLAFAMKAAAFPLHFWLPASYHTAKVIAAALFAGLLTKIGIYSLLRVMIMLYGERGAAFTPLIGWLGVATAILAGLAAIAQTDLKRMAAFLVISGIGVMLIGVGLSNEAGLAGTIVYAVHSILVMTALFLAIGYAERLTGSADASIGRNVYAVHPLAAGLFLVFAFAAAGLPPFSGFWPKLMLVQASLAEGGTAGIAGAVGVILSGFLTTVAAARAWSLVYLRPGDGPESNALSPALASSLGVPLVLFAALVLALGLFPGIVIGPATVGAAGLLDPAPYVERVLGR